MLEIKREDGIEERLEETRDKPNIKVESTKVEEVLDIYNFLRSHPQLLEKHPAAVESRFKFLRKEVTNQLSPLELEMFTHCQDSSDDTEIRLFGAFVATLMQNSYEAGYNNFTVNADPTPSFGFAAHCQGTKERLLKYKVVGRVSNFASSHNNYVTATYQDVGHFFGFWSKNCEFTLLGDVKSSIGEHAEHCIIRIANKEAFNEIMGSDAAQKNKIIYIGKC